MWDLLAKMCRSVNVPEILNIKKYKYQILKNLLLISEIQLKSCNLNIVFCTFFFQTTKISNMQPVLFPADILEYFCSILVLLHFLSMPLWSIGSQDTSYFIEDWQDGFMASCHVCKIFLTNHLWTWQMCMVHGKLWVEPFYCC